MDRRGRGRLDSLELLPEEAQDDVIWAIGELNRRERTQADILFELNDRLEVKRIGPISKSAFNRRAMRLSRRAAQLDERKYIYAGIAKELTPEAIGQSDIVLGEFLKTLIDELLDNQVDTKGAMELARAYKDTIQAQRLSADARRRADEEAAKKLVKATETALENVGGTGKTIDKAAILAAIREAYGVT